MKLYCTELTFQYVLASKGALVDVGKHDETQ